MFFFKKKEINSQILINETRRERADKLLGALNSAALAMQKVMTHEEIFAVMSAELKKVGLSSMIFPADTSGDKLFTRYLSLDPKKLAWAEKLVGVNLKEYYIPIDVVVSYSRAFRNKETVLVDTFVELTQQTFPKVPQKVIKEVIDFLNIQRAINAPIIGGDKVIGILSVQSKDLSEKDIPAVTAFAHQVAAHPSLK